MNNEIKESSGGGIELDVMYEAARAYYDEKMIDICKSLLKEIASNTNFGYPEQWYASYCIAKSNGGNIIVECRSFIINDVKNLSYNKMMNEILPMVRKHDPDVFLGWVTRQYTFEYYKSLMLSRKI